ncbi:MAG: ribulose-phosphate 3-epimerase [Planctomycetaceae bacterium]|nr:ribulose-phosphate 3-epimerase [Planctomycetaceae bacterium]
MSQLFWIADLVKKCPLINPSLLAADFANLASEIRAVEEAGAKILHLDVMDGHFVPNLSIGVPVVEAVRRSTELPLDVHLMLSEPQKYVRAFRKAGADLITVHIETLNDPRPLLEEIRGLGAAAGLAHNPPTAIEKLAPFLSDADIILTMSVTPGFGGQKFDRTVLDKIAVIKKHAPTNALISVDGGIDTHTIADCAKAGCHLFVAGTAIFGASDYAEQMRLLESQCRKNIQ